MNHQYDNIIKVAILVMVTILLGYLISMVSHTYTITVTGVDMSARAENYLKRNQ